MYKRQDNGATRTTRSWSYGVEAAIRLYLRRIVKIRQELEQLRKVKEEQIKKNDFKR
jgi:hypothetical protein